MNKILLFFLLLISIGKANGQDRTFTDTIGKKHPIVQPQNYSGSYNSGLIPDQMNLHDVFSDDDVPVPQNKSVRATSNNFTTTTFKNPYDGVKIPDTTPQRQVQKDAVDTVLNNIASTPTSKETQSANSSFDWGKTNADRFVHSPCITTLGFDPNANPKVQEQRYEDCEFDLNQQMLMKGLFIVLIVVGILLLLYFVIKSSKKKIMINQQNIKMPTQLDYNNFIEIPFEDVIDIIGKQYIFDNGESKANKILRKIVDSSKVAELFVRISIQKKMPSPNELLYFMKGLSFFLFAKTETICLAAVTFTIQSFKQTELSNEEKVRYLLEILYKCERVKFNKSNTLYTRIYAKLREEYYIGNHY